MARSGVGVEKIEEVVRQLETEGREPTVTAVRERLGAGSFSTIGAALADWRRRREDRARAAVPEPPDSLCQLAEGLWAEAWGSAARAHEPERQAFARERQELERARAEMAGEISRLEAESEAERARAARAEEQLRSEGERHREDVQAVRAALAAAEGALAEARLRSGREEDRNREFAERAIAEAATAEALRLRVAELESRA